MGEFDKIKKLREDLGLSQGEFADKLGIHQRDLSKMETGNRTFIPTHVVSQILRMGYDVNSLFDDKKEQVQKIDYSSILSEPSVIYGADREKKEDFNFYLNELIGYFNENPLADLSEFKAFLSAKKTQPVDLVKKVDRLEALVARLILQVGELQDQHKENTKPKL